MLKHGTAYVQQGMDDYEQPSRDRAVQSLPRRAKAFSQTLGQTSAGTLTEPSRSGAVPWELFTPRCGWPTGRN